MANPGARTARERRALELGRRAAELRRSGKASEAGVLLGEAVRLAPHSAGLVGNLGNALFASGARAQGLAALERACALEPGSGLLSYNLGKARLEAGQLAGARAALEQAVRLGGIEAEARVNLGRLEEIEGHLAEAAAHWRQAAELAPGLARPHYLLARVGLLEDRTPLERIAAAPGSSPRARVEACFGLGYAGERAGDFARAFEDFRRANELQRALLPPFDPERHEARLAQLTRTFDASFFRAHRAPHASPAPLFLVGLPRSGTTLAESILGAHPAVAARGERLELGRLAQVLGPRGYPAKPTALTPADLQAAAEEYLRALEVPPGAERVTDKLPGNYVHLGLVALLFTSARIVHCRRDPLDTALSLYCQLFEGDALVFSYDLGHIARVIRAERRLMQHWREVLPLAIHALDYEELVGALEPGARALLAFAGLPWDERCLARSGPAPVLTASAWRVRAPVDRSSVGRWRRYERELAPLRAALAAE